MTHTLGLANVNVHPEKTRPLLVSVEGAGMVTTGQTFAIGYAKEFQLGFPDPSACNTVIVVQTTEQFDALKALMTDAPERLNTICLTSQRGESWQHVSASPPHQD